MKAIALFTWITAWSFPCFAQAASLQKIDTPNAPTVVGAYSQAITLDLEQTKTLVFVSGQVPFDPKTGQMIQDDIHQATNRALDNLVVLNKSF
jgi:enamine deaminase RidA (YjgF/YER057c/UK114 family)